MALAASRHSSMQMASGEITASSQEIPQVLLHYKFCKILNMSNPEPDSVKRKMRDLERSNFMVNCIYGGGTTALHVACEYGNLELVDYLLDHPQIDVKKEATRDGYSAIHSAAIGGKVAIMQRLAADIPDFNFNVNVNKHGHSPLHLALGKGRVEMARFLIDQNCHLHQKDGTGATPLHFAARNGNKELLQLLEEKVPGIDVNQKSHAGLTALHYAAWNGRAEAVEWLCAREDIRLDEADSVEKNTALHWAAQGGQWQVVEILVKADLATGTGLMFKENRHKETVLELMERHAPSKLILLLHLFNEAGLLDMKAFLPIVLVKFVMGYGDASMIRSLEQALEYAVLDAEEENSYLSALKVLLGSDSSFACWLAERGDKQSALLYIKLKGPEQLKLDDLDHRNVAAALRNAILKGNTGFADVLAEHGRKTKKGNQCLLEKWLDNMDKDLTGNLLVTADLEGMFGILRKLDQKWFRVLRKLNKNAAGPATPEELFEDIPLAFWIFEAAGKQSMAEFLERHNAWGFVINKQGYKTRRTALHWANIFNRRQTASMLSQVKERMEDIPDVYCRTSSMYATKHREEARDALKSILVAAALIASMDFAGFLMSSSLGYPSRRQEAVLVNFGMQVFWVCSCLSFFFAIGSALLCLGGMLPLPDSERSIEANLYTALASLVCSMSLALYAFVSSLFADVRRASAYSRYTNLVLLTTAAGILLCTPITLWFFYRCFPMLKSALPIKPTADGGASINTSAATATADTTAVDGDAAHVNIQRVVYQVGSRYEEYPWEDGLDKVQVEHQASATAPATTAATAAEGQVESGRNSSTEAADRQLLAPHRRSPGHVRFTCIFGDATVTYWDAE